MTRFPIIRWTLLSTLAVALCQATFAAAADDAKPANGNLVPLKYEIPKALFVGTPKNIKASATLEAYSEKPRRRLMIPEGCTNLAAEEESDLQRLGPDHRRIVAGHRRR